MKTMMLAAIAATLLCAGVAVGATKIHYAESTAYCLSGTMADGTQVRRGSVASNRHPLGTRIWILGKGGPGGRHRWTVRDRIGWGSELDFWVASCAYARNNWGRRNVRYEVGWARWKR